MEKDSLHLLRCSRKGSRVGTSTSRMRTIGYEKFLYPFLSSTPPLTILFVYAMVTILGSLCLINTSSLPLSYHLASRSSLTLPSLHRLPAFFFPLSPDCLLFLPSTLSLSCLLLTYLTSISTHSSHLLTGEQVLKPHNSMKWHVSVNHQSLAPTTEKESTHFSDCHSSRSFDGLMSGRARKR